MEDVECLRPPGEVRDPGDVPHMSMETIGSVDFFKCNKCPYMALTAKDIQFHWQTSHSKNFKLPETKSITVKCPGCSGMFYSEISLKTHLRSHHKMCARDINKLVHSLIQQFKRNQEYFENMEVVIDDYSTNGNQNYSLLIEVPPDPKQVVIMNSNPPINVINIGGSSTNFIINTTNNVDNSNSYIMNTDVKLQPKNIDILTANATVKQNIIRKTFNSPHFNNFPKGDKTNSTYDKTTSILYNKLKGTDCVPDLLGIQSLLNTMNSTKQNKNTGGTGKHYKFKSKISDSCKKSSSFKRRDKNIEGYLKQPCSENSNILSRLLTSPIKSNSHSTAKLNNSNGTIVIENGILNSKNKIKEKEPSGKIPIDKKRNKHKKIINNRERMKLSTKICGISDCCVNLMSEDKLEYHRSCHINKSKDLHCPECKESNFITCASLHSHLWKKHQIDLNLFTCDVCQFKVFGKDQLSYHILTHSTEKKYACEVCAKAFKNSKQLATHRVIHRKNETTAFICDICNIHLKNARQLSQHKKIIHEKKKYFQCDLCNYASATKHSLHLHIIRHLGSKHLKCTHCKFQTGDKNVLRRHTQRHTIEKAYCCRYCPYSCIQASSLKSHIISKHSGNKDDVLFSCQQCSFTTFSKKKHQVHSSAHKEGTLTETRIKSLSKTSRKAKNKSSKSKAIVEETVRDDSVIEADVIIEVTDQNSISTPDVSEQNTNTIQNDRNVNSIVENNAENPSIQIIQKENTNYFSNIINPLFTSSIMYTPSNVTNEGFYIPGNKIENTLYNSNSGNEFVYNYSNKNNDTINSNQIASNNAMVSCSHVENNYVVPNVDADDNDTYFNNYESNLVINEEIPSSENTSSFNLCGTDNATDGMDSINNSFPTVNVPTEKPNKPSNSIKVSSNIFVKDILDLAASNIRTIPPNIYASDIQKSASHTPIILINPKTQTNNRIMGANIFTSNIINPSYSENCGSSQMLHLPNSTAKSFVPRKKPKISVKSNLILKGPDRLDNFDLQNHKSVQSSEYNLNTAPYSFDNYNMALDFGTNSQNIESNNINLEHTSEMISKDLYNSEHNYLSNYLLNSDFPLPNIQAPIISNETNMIQNNLNTIQTIPLESSMTDMSDVKLENKPYLASQSETMMSNLIGNNVHNNSNMFYSPPIHVPIKFEQKMDMLSSYGNKTSGFQNSSSTPVIDDSSTVEETGSFENINTGYNQSIYPFEDNYYFENDFITETLDGQEIIVLNDTWPDVKSVPDQYKQNDAGHRFDQSIQLPVNLNPISVKDKPRIISEIQITGNSLSNLGDVKKIGLPFECPFGRNTFTESDYPGDQQDVIFDLEQY